MGILQSLINESYPPKSHFSPSHIPDLSGLVVIVTGANSGIGKETVKELLTKNAKVYMAGRSEEKMKSAIEDLEQMTGKRGIFLKLDLNDLNSVKSAAEEFLQKESVLNILFNNAGVMYPPRSNVTVQGYEPQFGINVIGHFYLTQLLLPALRLGAQTSLDRKVRIIHTSSFISRLVDCIDYTTLINKYTGGEATDLKLYAQSKLANVMVSNEMARLYGQEGIVSISLHPGVIYSDLTRNFTFWQLLASKCFLKWYDCPHGALTQLWAGTSSEAAELNGQYLIPWARVGKCNPAAEDQAKRTELWNWLNVQVQKFD